MAVTGQTTFIAQNFSHSLTDHDTHILHRVMGVDLQIPFGIDSEIDQSVPGYLLEHVIKKRHTCVDLLDTQTIKIQLNGDLSFFGVSAHARLACR